MLCVPGRTADERRLVLTGSVPVQAVSAVLDYREDSGWELGPVDLLGPESGMRPLEGPLANFGYTRSKVWLRLRVVNATDIRSWRLRMHANFVEEIQVYLARPDGVTTLLDLDTSSPFAARPVPHAQMVAPVPLEPGERATILIGYWSEGTSILPISIATPQDFGRDADRAAFKNHLFYGMVLLLLAIALVLTATVRDWVFPAYFAYVGAVLLYLAHADGTAFQHLWPNAPGFNAEGNIVLGTAVIVFCPLYAMVFLRTARHHRVLHYVLLAIIVGTLALDLALWWTDPLLLKKLLVNLSLVSLLACLAAGIVAARRRWREVRFFVLGWASFVGAAALLNAAHTLGFDINQEVQFDTTRTALVFDAVLMAFAIADRFNLARSAQREAMAESLDQARRNLALSDRLNALEGRYERALAMARERDESARDAAHDLRQPMHALRLSLRALLDPARSDPARPGVARSDPADAERVGAALDYMEGLVADRLARSKPIRPVLPRDDPPRPVRSANGHRASNLGEPNATDEPTLHDVVRGVASMFEPDAAAKGLDLRVSLAAPDAMMRGYPLMRSLANLVSNAVKYTGDGSVAIVQGWQDGEAVIEVRDTGPGMTPAEFGRALERNQRLARDKDRAEGSGLGLAIVREIADAEGWTLQHAPGVDGGTTIRLTLGPATDAAGTMTTGWAQGPHTPTSADRTDRPPRPEPRSGVH